MTWKSSPQNAEVLIWGRIPFGYNILIKSNLQNSLDEDSPTFDLIESITGTKLLSRRIVLGGLTKSGEDNIFFLVHELFTGRKTCGVAEATRYSAHLYSKSFHKKGASFREAPHNSRRSTRRSRGKTHIDAGVSARHHALCVCARSTCPKSRS